MRVSPRALLVLRGGALSAIAVAFAAATAPAPARVVRVDVIASDARGRIVGTLKPADFDVIENGAPQALEDVRFVKVDGRDAADAELTPIRSEFDEQAEAARDGTRLFAILLDEYHVSAGANTDRAREAMTGFVDRDLGPRDLVALFKPLDSLLTIRVTRDHDLLRHAIESFEGRKGDYEPRNAFERNFIAGAPARIDQVRTQVVLSALNALVVHLGKLSDGRKAVLVVGEGLGRAARRRGLEGLPTADSVIRAANRYNVSIYAIDPQLPPDAADGNRPADRPASDVDTLRTIAEGTDGRASSAGHLAETMRQMVDDSSGYYRLTDRAAPPHDGEICAGQGHIGVRLRSRRVRRTGGPDSPSHVDRRRQRAGDRFRCPRDVGPRFEGAGRARHRRNPPDQDGARVPGRRRRSARRARRRARVQPDRTSDCQVSRLCARRRAARVGASDEPDRTAAARSAGRSARLRRRALPDRPEARDSRADRILSRALGLE